MGTFDWYGDMLCSVQESTSQGKSSFREGQDPASELAVEPVACRAMALRRGAEP